MSSNINYKNIYKMLMYAVEELRCIKIRDIEYESFKALNDLYASILITSMQIVLGKWLNQGYSRIESVTNKPKGKINIEKSIKNGYLQRGLLDYIYFKLEVDTAINRVIKLAIKILLSHPNGMIDTNKRKLNAILSRMYNVSDISLMGISIKSIDTQGLSEEYKSAFYISKILIEEMITKEDGGERRLIDVEDEKRLPKLFEKFIRGYYKTKSVEHRNIRVSAKEFNNSKTANTYFNKYKTDVTIENNDMNKTLIIDTKWHNDVLGNNLKIKSTNQMQLEVYIRNYKDINKEADINGILLYAKPNKSLDIEEIENEVYFVSEPEISRIYIKILDLDQDFELATKKLDEIFNEFVLG